MCVACILLTSAPAYMYLADTLHTGSGTQGVSRRSVRPLDPLLRGDLNYLYVPSYMYARHISHCSSCGAGLWSSRRPAAQRRPPPLRAAFQPAARVARAGCRVARAMHGSAHARPHGCATSLNTLSLYIYAHILGLLSRLCVRGRSVSLALRCCECCTARCPTLSWRRCVLYAIALGNVLTLVIV